MLKKAGIGFVLASVDYKDSSSHIELSHMRTDSLLHIWEKLGQTLAAETSTPKELGRTLELLRQVLKAELMLGHKHSSSPKKKKAK